MSSSGDQKPTVLEALRAVTIEPARQNGLERWIGTIEIGKVADFVLLDKNPLDITPPPEQIHAIQVRATFVGGYRNDWIPSAP